MKIIGITGGTGSGKTTALNYLEGLGACVIDCDAVYHELLQTSEPMLQELDTRFPGVVTGGALDRKALGAIVFQDQEALEDLNAITHAYVRAAVRERLLAEREAGRSIAAVDAIALLESGLGDLCCRTVGVIAPVEVRCRRIMARDGISEAYAMARITAQKSDEFFIDNCDLVLENPGDDPEAFFRTCEILLQQLLNDITPEEEF